MKRIGLLTLICGTLFLQLALGAESRPSASVRKLEISLGRWVFHGKTFGKPGAKPGVWTWNEDCAWSQNRLFLECTFSNVWSGKPVESLVVDTYNSADHEFWHYELYASGEHGAHPYVTPMTVKGNRWIEDEPGKKSRDRIVYVWESSRRVKVTIEKSTDGVHWTVTDEGIGIKQ